MAFEVDVIIEIPKNSNIKYEMKNGKIIIDRIMYPGFKYPQNYGFIENTLDWDGDPLDVLIIADAEIISGTVVLTRIIGAMQMIDEGETDTKLIGVIQNDFKYSKTNSLRDLNSFVLDQIKEFFETYKKYKNSLVVVPGFKGSDYAACQLGETRKLFTKYHNLKKEKFLDKMMKEHPEKYQK